MHRGYVDLRSVYLRNLDLRNADLGNLDFGNSNLGNVDFGHANLRNADLWYLYSRYLHGGNLHRRNLDARNPHTYMNVRAIGAFRPLHSRHRSDYGNPAESWQCVLKSGLQPRLQAVLNFHLTRCGAFLLGFGPVEGSLLTIRHDLDPILQLDLEVVVLGLRLRHGRLRDAGANSGYGIRQAGRVFIPVCNQLRLGQELVGSARGQLDHGSHVASHAVGNLMGPFQAAIVIACVQSGCQNPCRQPSVCF